MLQSDVKQWKRVQLRRDGRFSTYFHTLSHDLRTPLTQITGFAELLNLDEKLAPGQKEYAGLIVSACGELNHAVLAHLRLIERSLDYDAPPDRPGDEDPGDTQPEQPRENRGWPAAAAEFGTGSRVSIAR